MINHLQCNNQVSRFPRAKAAFHIKYQNLHLGLK